MLGDGCCLLKSKYSPVTIRIGVVLEKVAMWHILVFALIITSELLHTEAQLDIHESSNQPVQYYDNLGPQFVTEGNSLYQYYAGHCPFSELYLIYTTFLALAVLPTENTWF
jgi:hypothetical protein